MQLRHLAGILDSSIPGFLQVWTKHTQTTVHRWAINQFIIRREHINRAKHGSIKIHYLILLQVIISDNH